jgi:hypothetical protein
MLTLHTNDYLVSTSPIRYRSTSKNINYKYQISKMIPHFFSIQRVLPRRIQTKYFSLIKNNLIKRISIITQRRNSSNNRNKITRTFFKFTYKKYRFYLVYTPLVIFLLTLIIIISPGVVYKVLLLCATITKALYP